MSNKEIAIDVIRKLPESASLHEMAREIEFVAAVREGFEQLERGEGVPAEQVREMIPSWIVRSAFHNPSSDSIAAPVRI
jgi:predicted transcriptional regulator